MERALRTVQEEGSDRASLDEVGGGCGVGVGGVKDPGNIILTAQTMEGYRRVLADFNRALSGTQIKQKRQD